MIKYKLYVYGFFCYSTKVWDEFNDNVLKLRKKARILRGGLQFATNGMPQGRLIVIPLTSDIGYQQQSHIILHFDCADPDLGRKGFQPELHELGERIAISIVNVLKQRRNHLKKDSGAPPNILEDSAVDSWIKQQLEFEKSNPLTIKNKEFFLPTREISLTCEPRTEQDVVALFNQLVAGGVIRGLKIMATSGSEKYDGIYRVWLKEPLDNHLFDKEKNPLGISKRALSEEFVSKPYILEYKYDIDALIREFETNQKTEKNINLAIAWNMGENWNTRYTINPLLHFDNIQNRIFHGATHDFRNSTTGDHLFYAIILSELVDYINDPDNVQAYQKSTYSEENLVSK